MSITFAQIKKLREQGSLVEQVKRQAEYAAQQAGIRAAIDGIGDDVFFKTLDQSLFTPVTVLNGTLTDSRKSRTGRSGRAKKLPAVKQVQCEATATDTQR